MIWAPLRRVQSKARRYGHKRQDTDHAYVSRNSGDDQGLADLHEPPLNPRPAINLLDQLHMELDRQDT